METYPVPVGLVPAVTPKSGTRLESMVELLLAVAVAEAVALVAVAVATELLAIDTALLVIEQLLAAELADEEAATADDIDDAEVEPPDTISFCRLAQLVAASGQPFPVPLKFCRVTEHACSRASCDSTELSSGKVTATVGLLSTFPAATFLFSSCAN